MMKTTRFRPIAPRPQEGANATKDKPSATAPAKATSSVKVETKKVETLTKAPAQQVKPEVPIHQGEISLDPMNFCYPELKPGSSDFDTSSGMSSAYFGGFNSYYGGGYSNVSPRMHYIGQNMGGNGNPGSGSHAGASGRMGRPGGPIAFDGQQSFNSVGGYGGPMNNSMVQFPPSLKSNAAENNNANKTNNNLSMKLDLDEDSVAKAFGDEYESSKDRTRESDGSVDANESSEPTSRASEQPRQSDKAVQNNTNNKSNSDLAIKKEEGVEMPSHQGGGVNSDADTVQTQAPVDCRLAACGSVVRNLSHKGFVNCIAKGSTNPLFHIEKRLACSFISEFLENENIMENFKDSQKIRDALQELDSFASEEVELNKQPALKKQKV